MKAGGGVRSVLRSAVGGFFFAPPRAALGGFGTPLPPHSSRPYCIAAPAPRGSAASSGCLAGNTDEFAVSGESLSALVRIA